MVMNKVGSKGKDHFRGVLWKFALLCVPIRLLIVFVAWFGMRWKGYNIVRYALGVMGLMVGVGFLYLHVSGDRPLSVAGDKAWWNRLAHSLFYFAFGVRVLMGDKDAYLFLLADVVYGVGSFLVHHIGNGDFVWL
jgi:hypothetical protein